VLYWNQTIAACFLKKHGGESEKTAACRRKNRWEGADAGELSETV
jgi:hypothetical protein